jgi:hypothetical protein
MRVQFHKTDERRYGVVILRDGSEPLRMRTAPGNDPLMPHDLQHFIAEQELGIGLGIFGQVAAGGTAGTFHGATNTGKAKRRSKNLSRDGRDDSARSERATYVCVFNWLAASSNPALRRRAADMADEAKSMLALMEADERRSFDPPTVARINARMERLSQEWVSTPIGGCLELRW